MTFDGVWTINQHTGYESIALTITDDGDPLIPRYVDVFRTDSLLNKTLLREGDRVPLVGRTWLGNDYEMPLGQYYGYHANVYQAHDDTEPIAQVGTVPTRRMLPASPGRPYLSIALSPTNSMPVWVESFAEVGRESQSGTFNIIGRSAPVVVSSVRSSRTGTLGLVTRTLAERDQLWGLLESGQVLLLRTEGQYGFDSLYFAAGDVSESRVTPLGTNAIRRFSIDFVETDIPVGQPFGNPLNSWQQVLDHVETWQAVMDFRANWLEVYEIPFT